MTMRLLSICLVFVFSLAAPKGETTSASSLDAYLALAQSDKVIAFELFYIPEDQSGTVSLDPPDVEQRYFTRVIIRHLQGTKFVSKLNTAMRDSDIRQQAKITSDFRWACIFLDANGKRLVSMYFTRFGDGLVEGVKVRSNGKLLGLLRQKFIVP